MDYTPFMVALWLCRCTQLIAAVLLVGTAALRLLATGTGIDPVANGWRTLSWLSGIALVLTGIWQIALTAAEMSGESLARVTYDGVLVEVVARTHFGAVWRVRMVLEASWVMASVLLDRPLLTARRFPQVLEWLPASLAMTILGSLVFAGHTQASEKSTWLLPVTVAHAVAAGAWPGGLLPLSMLLARARNDPHSVPAVTAVTRRYSRLSVGAVCLLAFSGLLNGIGMVGNVEALWANSYGRLVLCKVVLFAALVGIGACNRRLVYQTPTTDRSLPLRRLWRNVTIECFLAVGVLLATEALGTTAPPMPSH